MAAPLPPVPGRSGRGLPASRPTFPSPGFRARSAARAEPPAAASRRAPAAEVRATESGASPFAGIGAGIADLLAERLLGTGAFRLLERREIGALTTERTLRDSVTGDVLRRARLLGARYLIAGSITRFGSDESRLAGGGGTRGGIGGFGFRRRTTTVVLVARVSDVATGEIVAIVRGVGSSKKGGSLTLGGIGGGVGGIATVGSDAWRNSAFGDATERAVEQLAARLVEQRARMR
jgi:curli biogenesis system outer membrane secretion channel CsgG